MRPVLRAQRHRLFTLGNEMGTSDFDDPATRTHLASAVRTIADMLADHAENERRYIHPLFAMIGGAAERIEHEHHDLEALFDGWVEIVNQGRWAELYGATMRIIGQYLLHIDAEERAQAEVLWPNYAYGRPARSGPGPFQGGSAIPWRCASRPGATDPSAERAPAGRPGPRSVSR